jgi:hypothetical protein
MYSRSPCALPRVVLICFCHVPCTIVDFPPIPDIDPRLSALELCPSLSHHASRACTAIWDTTHFQWYCRSSWYRYSTACGSATAHWPRPCQPSAARRCSCAIVGVLSCSRRCIPIFSIIYISLSPPFPFWTRTYLTPVYLPASSSVCGSTRVPCHL